MKYFTAGIHKKRSWRKNLNIRSANIRRMKRRGVLICVAFLVWLLIFLSGRFPKDAFYVQVMRQEREYRIQMVTSESVLSWDPGEVYGIRFCPERLEIQFYHRRGKKQEY